MSSRPKYKRILVVDDSIEIHKNFVENLSLTHYEAQEYDIDTAHQGKKALEMVQKAVSEGRPYELGFIDIRTSLGWDSVETIKRIWEVDPRVQMILCSAYLDRSCSDITHELGNSDKFFILKKPFEPIEVSQFSHLLANLYDWVKNRTVELDHLYSLTHTTLESTQDGILAVRLDKHIVMYNNNLLKQWSITEDIFKSKHASAVFKKMSESVENVGAFLEEMNDLNVESATKEAKEWQLKVGTTLKSQIHFQYLHGEMIGIVYSFRDITEQKKLEKQLLYQATHDGLTGLPNRALLLDRMEQAIDHAKRFNLNVGILLLNLDGFKEINDALGHKAGDDLLKYQAQKLSKFLSVNDTVARLGGDEFVIVFAAQSSEKNLLDFLNKLQSLLLTPCKIEGHEVNVTASMGISFYPQDGCNADILLKNADAAMYQAKVRCRNGFQFYTAEFNKHVLERAELKAALGQALQKQELSLNYQPLIDLITGKIIGLEALLRWKHPTLGMIPPDTFIPIAEESGLIIAIGEWVLKTACTQTQIWHQSPNLAEIKISVNISVKQFRQQDFVTIVRNILDSTQLNPESLELEITESLILGSVSDVIQKMYDLKSLGVRFAMDDFGTGYSSLSYLKHFPFDTVKIDKSFMDNITTDTNSASIVEAIIGMTKRMGIDVLAEGVEHVEQVNFLKEHHSNQVQGYYYSEPLSEAACTALLQQGIPPSL